MILGSAHLVQLSASSVHSLQEGLQDSHLALAVSQNNPGYDLHSAQLSQDEPLRT
jgi:hypothetical protein